VFDIVVLLLLLLVVVGWWWWVGDFDYGGWYEDEGSMEAWKEGCAGGGVGIVVVIMGGGFNEGSLVKFVLSSSSRWH
jgi:hypothetical protein